jgi:hypothetical protein
VASLSLFVTAALDLVRPLTALPLFSHILSHSAADLEGLQPPGLGRPQPLVLPAVELSVSSAEFLSAVGVEPRVSV